MGVGIKPLEPSKGIMGSKAFSLGTTALTGGFSGGLGKAALGVAGTLSPGIGQITRLGKTIDGMGAQAPTDASAPTAIDRRLSLYGPGQAPTFSDPSADLMRNLRGGR